MKRKITLKDIARELDVSISTVSKALKNSEEIGRDTKEKVQAFARLYNYKPNNVAISLQNKRTKNIGVVIPEIVHYFFTTVFRGIERYANDRGYNVIVCVSDGSFDKEVINIEMLANGSVDGFILSLASETFIKKDYAHLKSITDQGIPVVLFDNITHEVPCDKVIINDCEVAFEAVDMLVKDGRQRIGLVATTDYSHVSEERVEGYKEALAKNGIRIDESNILRLPVKEFEDERFLNFLKERKLDAVLCVNEIMAIHGIGLARSLGLEIPKDIAFVGFTDGIMSKYTTPSLTTVAQHGDKMGEMAAKMLIERVEAELEDDSDEPLSYRTEVIRAKLIKREST